MQQALILPKEPSYVARQSWRISSFSDDHDNLDSCHDHPLIVSEKVLMGNRSVRCAEIGESAEAKKLGPKGLTRFTQ